MLGFMRNRESTLPFQTGRTLSKGDRVLFAPTTHRLALLGAVALLIWALGSIVLGVRTGPRLAAAQVEVPASVQLCEDISFWGVCETFWNHDPDLGSTRVGALLNNQT